MGEVTGIGWTDATHNHWIGCTEVGPACDLCYARELDRRYQWGREPRKPGEAPHWGVGAPRYLTADSNRLRPRAWNKKAEAARRPLKVFCNSLSDVFDNEVPDAWRADLFGLWKATPWLRWQVVTKRVPNILKMLPADWSVTNYPNVGFIATVVTQDEYDRDAPRLLDIPARWHGFSIEPQIEPIIIHPTLINGRGSVWAITGGESAQPRARRSDGKPVQAIPRQWNPVWAETLIMVSRALPNFKVFVKQTGARPIGLECPADGMGKDPSAWPEAIRVQQFPKELLS
jgi:protein gp37